MAGGTLILKAYEPR